LQPVVMDKRGAGVCDGPAHDTGQTISFFMHSDLFF